MLTTMNLEARFPGPPWLGRGLVVEPGDPLPAPADTWPTMVIDEATLSEPEPALDALDAWWRNRVPSVVVLDVPFAALKEAERIETEPYHLDPSFEFRRERLHFLVWINRYDGRGGRLRWHHGERALRLGAEASTAADVAVAGVPAWIDGGPRGSLQRSDVIHVESVWAGSLELDGAEAPRADLAPDQMQAVQHPFGAARVIAPAGSGKTRVLTERMRHLLTDRSWNPDSVTALAYNRRAAEEMTSRLTGAGPAHVRTLHAFGYEILGRARGGRPRILGEREIRRLLERHAPVRPRANEDAHAPYIEALSEIRTALRSPQEIEEERDDVPGLAELFPLYRRDLGRMGAIDHDEQIYGAVEALLADPDLRHWAQSRCRHLLVDEFQDLTACHLLMIRLLSAPAYDTFGVGDDDQVIYGYAGASPLYLLDYQRYFPGASQHELEANYRCPAPVVEAASRLLSHNGIRIRKQIRAGKESPSHDAIEIVRAREADMGKQLLSVVSSILDRADASDIAILTRVNVGLLVPQITLAEAGLPADTVLDPTLLERSGVRTAMAWLRLASAAAHDEPMAGPDLVEATRRPGRGLSPGVRSALGRGSWLLDRLAAFADGSNDARTGMRLQELVDDITELSALASEGSPVAEQLVFVRDRLRLGSALDRLDNSRGRPTGGHSDDLDALIVLAHTHPEVDAFEPWLRSSLDRSQVGGSRITLSTVHRVKGLEWPHVIVWDASTGVMPYRLAEDVEEERRIFHVALTRCSESVTIIGRTGAMSRFVPELTGAAPALEPKKPSRPGITPEIGMRMRWQGYSAVVVGIDDRGVSVKVGGASRLTIDYGETVAIDGRRVRLQRPA